MQTQTYSSQDVTQLVYDREIPPFVELELERLYGSMYSSLAHFRVYGGLELASTYVAARDGKLVTLLLFRRERQQVKVLNEWMRLSEEDITRFTDFIFKTYPAVSVVSFRAIEPELERCAYPVQRFPFTENIVVDLPPTPSEYTAMLGAATRKNIKRHKNRVERDFPSFEFKVYEREEIQENDIRDIVAFNHARMAVKNKTSVISETEVRRLTDMARQRGVVMLVRIGGRVCAGTIAFRIGRSMVSRVNAHDPTYDDYRLGMVCCYMGVCEAIVRGAREFHFMWGRYDYKFALLGVLKRLDNIVLYRSPAQMLMNGVLAARLTVGSYVRETRSRLAAGVKENDTLVYRMLGKSLQTLKSMKRLRPA